MKINRHNYEEYFLLYIDNELQQEERDEVDSFIAQNSDLADELNLLQLTVLPAADISFSDKSLLFKKEDGISLSNYQAFFLLYVDNELTAAQAEDVERFVLQHPALQSGFTLTKKSKLEPGHIVFKEKKSLYRNEKVRRIVPLTWLRIGMAAAVLGLIALVGIFTQNKFTGNSSYNTFTQTKRPAVKPHKNTINTVTNRLQEPLHGKINDDNALVKQDENSVSTLQKKGIKTNHNQLQQNVAVHKPVVQDYESVNSHRPAATGAPEEPKQKNEKESLVQQPVNDKNSSTKTGDADILKEARNQTMDGQPALVSATVYRELNTNDDDRSLYIGSAAINKNKIKGLFKKAARLFGKNSSDSEK